MKSVQLNQAIWMAMPTLYLNMRGVVERMCAYIILITTDDFVSSNTFYYTNLLSYQEALFQKSETSFFHNIPSIKCRKVTFEGCLQLVIPHFLYPHTMHCDIISHINQFIVCIWDYKLLPDRFQNQLSPQHLGQYLAAVTMCHQDKDIT